MTGYVRVDTGNNIADGNVIAASDLDNEFDGIQAAFNASTGHNHDGTTGEGAPILVLGPTQDVVVGASAVTPKTTNTVDIGSSSLKFKDLYTAGNASIGGTLAVTGVATLTAQPILSSLTASRAVFTDGSKGLVSNAITGTGNVVMSASPTLTGTITAEALTLSGAVTASGGTANGVAYLNGSKVLTTGSALTFDGTTFTVPSDIASPGSPIIYSYNGGSAGSVRAGVQFVGTDPSIRSYISGSEQMRLTSTGLGIGTSSPSNLLQTKGSGAAQMGVYRTNSTTGVGVGFEYAQNNASSAETVIAQTFGVLTTNTAGAEGGAFTVHTKNAGTLAERLRIDSSGNFTIGGQTATRLEVNLTENDKVELNAVDSTNTARNLVFSTGDSERARIDSSGNLLVGTTSAANSCRYTFAWDGATQNGVTFNDAYTGGATATSVFFRRNGTNVGSITTTATTTAYNTSSDYRLKENIAPMTGALAKVAALKPVTYTWKADGSAGEGFIAHELAEVCPAAVTGEKDAVDADGKPQYQGIDVSFLVGTLTAAIQEQQAIIEDMKTRLAAAGI